MTPPYAPQVPDDVEQALQDEGYGRNDDIVPSLEVLPTATGPGFDEATDKLFENKSLDPQADAQLINEVALAS